MWIGVLQMIDTVWGANIVGTWDAFFYSNFLHASSTVLTIKDWSFLTFCTLFVSDN